MSPKQRSSCRFNGLCVGIMRSALGRLRKQGRFDAAMAHYRAAEQLASQVKAHTSGTHAARSARFRLEVLLVGRFIHAHDAALAQQVSGAIGSYRSTEMEALRLRHGIG